MASSQVIETSSSSSSSLISVQDNLTYTRSFNRTKQINIINEELEQKEEIIIFNRDRIISTITIILTDLIKEQEKKMSSLDNIPVINATSTSTTATTTATNAIIGMNTIQKQKQTSFHAKKIPGISIHDYLKRIGDYSQCSDECFIYALIYIDKIGEKNPEFGLDRLNIHRILLLSIILAAKFYDDKFYENKYYASIGGVSVQEFVLLEKEYLFKYIDFKLYITPETYNLYYEDLLKFYKEKVALGSLKNSN